MRSWALALPFRGERPRVKKEEVGDVDPRGSLLGLWVSHLQTVLYRTATASGTGAPCCRPHEGRNRRRGLGWDKGCSLTRRGLSHCPAGADVHCAKQCHGRLGGKAVDFGTPWTMVVAGVSQTIGPKPNPGVVRGQSEGSQKAREDQHTVLLLYPSVP